MAKYLSAQHVQHYLPLIQRVTVRGRHKEVSRVPLFPGYVFLAGEIEDGYGAMATKRVCQIIPIHDQCRFVQEISSIRHALEQGGTLELYPFAAVGRRCRVRKGPFRGIEGMVIERIKPTRLILHVDILGRGAALEVDADLLEPCA